MITSKKYILFDLDGTLTDPKLGICTCVQYALKSFDIDEADLDKLEPFIGPPLKDSFMQYYGLSEEQAIAAIEKYRERFSVTGKFENEVYEGIPQLLSDLKDYGYHLAVASSKPECFVKDIMDHFRIAKYFDVIVGSELDGTRIDKAEVIHEALNQLFHYGKIRTEQVVMIGDRKFDVEGAKEIGVTSVAVSYGYGSLEELQGANPDYLIESVEGLQHLFMEEAELEIKRDEGRKREAEQLKEAQIAAAAAQRAQYEASVNHAEASDGPEQKASLYLVFWKLIYPLLLFYCAHYLFNHLIRSAVYYLSEQSETLYKLLTIENAATKEVSFAVDVAAIMTMISSALVVFIMYKMGAGEPSLKRGNNPKLKFEGSDWFKWIMIALCMAVGINILFSALGVLNFADYAKTADGLYSVSFGIGILLYGVFSPIMEELIFRGILFTQGKTLMRPKAAAILSALAFGFFHGNSVQMVYGFILGLVLSYAYHYSGQFIVPVVLHSVVNLVVYVSSTLGMFNVEEGSELFTGIIILVMGIWLFAKNSVYYKMRMEKA